MPAVEAPVTNPVAYEVRLEGDLPKATRDLIEQSSALMTQKDRPPASYAALSKRVDDDIGRIKDVLASEGYYEPDVEATIDADVEPAQVVVSIDPGALFHLEAVDIRYQPAEPVTAVPTTAADLGLGIGEAAAGAPLVEAERRLVRQLDENGYPNARIVGSQYLANRETKTITATWTVDTGPLARFGELRVDGLKDVDPEYVQQNRGLEARHSLRHPRNRAGSQHTVEDPAVRDDHAAAPRGRSRRGRYRPRDLRGQRGAAPVGRRRPLLFHR